MRFRVYLGFEKLKGATEAPPGNEAQEPRPKSRTFPSLTSVVGSFTISFRLISEPELLRRLEQAFCLCLLQLTPNALALIGFDFNSVCGFLFLLRHRVGLQRNRRLCGSRTVCSRRIEQRILN